MRCDPYAKVVFAGKSAKTTALETTYHPKWKEEIHLLAQVPSMFSHIKFQLWDHDTMVNDDIIATHFFNLREISVASNGYLPTFGPAYVPMYGSPRKYQPITTAHHKLIDEGDGEGMAYHGRVLVEISATPLGDKKLLNPKPRNIGDPTLAQVQKHTTPIEYHLRVTMSEASLLNSDIFYHRHDISFEVSLGMYGSLEGLPRNEATKAFSTTLPSRPQKDGENYFHLAWSHTKPHMRPCIEFKSSWEDVRHRIEELNQHRNIMFSLKDNIAKVEGIMQPAPSGEITPKQVEDAITELNDAFKALIATEDFLKEAKNKLPKKLASGVWTHLDLKLKERRNEVRAKISPEAETHRKLLAEKHKEKERREAVDDGIATLKAFAERLAVDSVEPQIGIPDIIVTLLHGKDRVAYYRFPVADYFWATEPDTRGPLFAKSQTVFLKSYSPQPKRLLDDLVPGQLRLNISFGPEDTYEKWPKPVGHYVALFEYHQNQRSASGIGDKWTIKLPSDPPEFTDRKFKELQFSPDKIKTEEGWTLGDEEIDTNYTEEDNHINQEEVYEHQRWNPTNGFTNALGPLDPENFSDVTGVCKRDKDTMKPPPGWVWKKEPWQVDHSRQGDEDGWQYAFDFGYAYHKLPARSFVRRRRHYRERERDPNKEVADDAVVADPGQENEGWHYSFLDFSGFRNSRRAGDCVRTRRCHRELHLTDKEKSLADVPSNFPSSRSSTVARASLSGQGSSRRGRERTLRPLCLRFFRGRHQEDALHEGDPLPNLGPNPHFGGYPLWQHERPPKAL